MGLFPVTDIVNISKYNGIDRWGKPSYLPPVQYNCRIDETIEKVQNQYGDEVVSSAQIFIEDVADVSYDDQISYTNVFDESVQKTPVRIEPLKDFGGQVIYTVIYL